MNPLDAFWHLLNFFAPAFAVGTLTPLMAKLLWRSALSGVGAVRLMAWCTGLSALSWSAALAVLGRDGRMASYAAMLVVCSLSLWWLGFVARSK